MEMEYRWNRNGMKIDWKWKENENGMEREYDENGSKTGWKWNENGMKMERT